VQAQVKLGRIAGISIGLHYSWFIIAFLIAVSLADHFHTVTPEWSKAVVWSAAIITGVLFFVALITPHEVKGVDPERWAQTSRKVRCARWLNSRRSRLTLPLSKRLRL